MNPELEQIWSRIQAELAIAVDETTYRVWLKPLRASELSPTTLTIATSAGACGWIRERFGRLLRSSSTTVIGRDVEILITDIQASLDTASNAHGQQPPANNEPCFNPRYTFNQFVIGDSNRLAHAAALTVAELPGQAYNPLFLCGPPGVGKTHLLHSIAALLRTHNPGLTLRFATGETFTNEFQLALGSGHMSHFKNRFREVGVLLIDDVQFLERKAKTEEEFFHTFNALHEAGAQIVLTSDRPPRDLQALEDRLRERFGAGLLADIHPPDFNTRVAILRKRANQDQIRIDDEHLLETIAGRAIPNVRALEGALIRTVAYSSLTGRPLTEELADEVLNNLYPNTTANPCSIAQIKEAACRHFDLSPEELLSTGRARRLTWPRQVAMYLSRELTTESLPAIGRQFGGRDHTTVLHAWRRTAAKLASDDSCRDAVDILRRDLEHP